MKTILLTGVWQLIALAITAFLGGVWYANNEKTIEALSCMGITLVAGCLARMISETIRVM